MSDAVRRQRDPSADLPLMILLAIIRFVTRWLGALAYASVWMALTLVLLAVMTPMRIGPSPSGENLRNTALEDIRNLDGIDLRVLTMPGLLLAVTVLHFLPLIPFTLVPYGLNRRITWLSWVSFGWMAAILGATVVLMMRGRLEVEPIPTFAGKDVMGGTVAGMTLIGILCCWLGSKKVVAALLGTVLLLAGCLRAQGEIFGSAELFGLRGKVPEGLAPALPWLLGNGLSGGLGQGLLLLVMFAIVLIAIAIAMAGDLESFGQSAGLGMMIVGLIAVAAVCLGVFLGRVGYAGDDDLGVFIIAVGIFVAAPFWGFLGSPATEGRRIGWAIVLLLALGPTLSFLNSREAIWSRQLGGRSLTEFWQQECDAGAHVPHRLWMVP